MVFQRGPLVEKVATPCVQSRLSTMDVSTMDARELTIIGLGAQLIPFTQRNGATALVGCLFL